MRKEVIWSLLSENDLDLLLTYLNAEWNANVVNCFLDELDRIITLIADTPQLFPCVHKKKKVRKCVISKHNSLYYRIMHKHVEILRLFDNRQHPSKLHFD